MAPPSPPKNPWNSRVWITRRFSSSIWPDVSWRLHSADRVSTPARRLARRCAPWALINRLRGARSTVIWEFARSSDGTAGSVEGLERGFEFGFAGVVKGETGADQGEDEGQDAVAFFFDGPQIREDGLEELHGKRNLSVLHNRQGIKNGIAE